MTPDGRSPPLRRRRPPIKETWGSRLGLGYQELKTDLEVVRAVRGSVGKEVVLMSDYNQSLSVVEAQGRAAALEDEGLYWIEEPTRADDYSGHAQIRRDTEGHKGGCCGFSSL